MATQTNLTSILITKPLHKRLKAIAQAKGFGIQEFTALEMERVVTREEARKK